MTLSSGLSVTRTHQNICWIHSWHWSELTLLFEGLCHVTRNWKKIEINRHYKWYHLNFTACKLYHKSFTWCRKYSTKWNKNRNFDYCGYISIIQTIRCAWRISATPNVSIKHDTVFVPSVGVNNEMHSTTSLVWLMGRTGYKAKRKDKQGIAA